MDYGWKVHDDLCGSNHFPILLEILQLLHDERLSHWKLNKANWEVFKTLCEQKLFQDPNTTNQTKYFTEKLISIANKSIAKTSTLNKNNALWFNDDCRKAICLYKAALCKFNNQPTTTNLNDFKLLRAKTWKLIKEAKKKSWQNCQPTELLYQNQPNLKDDKENLQKTLTNHPLKHLTKKQTEANTRKDIAEVLAETFSENSSLKNSNPQFIFYKSKSEKQRLNFKTNNLEKYNLPFKLAELKEAIQTSHNTAVGPDEIHYVFLKHLTKNYLNYLLKIFNDIWINGTFLESWKIATIIPISAPGKDNSNPANNCPIALTSCLCKTTEHMVNKRLVWYLESNKLITNSQCGFRKCRSTVDHVVKWETSIRQAYI